MEGFQPRLRRATAAAVRTLGVAFVSSCTRRGEATSIAEPPQTCRGRLTDVAVAIPEGGEQGGHGLVILDPREPSDGGAAHLGMLVAEGREQLFQRVRVAGGVQALKRFPAHFGAA